MVRGAIVHDVCDVHWPEQRDRLDPAGRAAYDAIIANLQWILTYLKDLDMTTRLFCEWGRHLPTEPLPVRSKPRGEPL